MIVQAGHVAPREPGFESATGTRGEQEFTLALRHELVELLRADHRFEPVPLPGRIPKGIRADAAIFLHGDGSGDETRRGFCFGYPMHGANLRLAGLIGAELVKIPGHPPRGRDNYTRDLSGYYGFRRVDTTGPEVLVEHGFLTSPIDRSWMLGNLSRIAIAHYRALCSYFGVRPIDTTTAELRRRTGFYSWLAWYEGREEWKEYGPRNPRVRPNVPKVIAAAWWTRRKVWRRRQA